MLKRSFRNIVFSCKLTSHQCFLALRFLSLNFIFISLVPPRCYITHISSFSSYNGSNVLLDTGFKYPWPACLAYGNTRSCTHAWHITLNHCFTTYFRVPVWISVPSTPFRYLPPHESCFQPSSLPSTSNLTTGCAVVTMKTINITSSSVVK
jgi:hypothetical protein